MSGPVDVQAERLRADELSIRLRTYADQVPTVLSIHNLREDLRAALALLAGQAEQIERLTRQHTASAEPAIMYEDYNEVAGFWHEAESRAEAAVCQRDNLRDALQQAERDLLAIYNAGFDSSRREIANRAIENVRVALRAAAVGEDERREKSRDEWEREYDDAVQCRDWQTCDQLLAERVGLSWWPVGEEEK